MSSEPYSASATGSVFVSGPVYTKLSRNSWLAGSRLKRCCHGDTEADNRQANAGKYLPGIATIGFRGLMELAR